MKIIVFIRDRVIGLRKKGKWYCITLPFSITDKDIYKVISSWAGSEPFTLELVE